MLQNSEVQPVGKNRPNRPLVVAHLLAASAAKSQLASMMNSGNLQAIFGDEIAGIPTETVLAITQAKVWGSGAIL